MRSGGLRCSRVCCERAVLFSMVRYGAARHGTLSYHTARYGAMLFDTARCGAVRRNTIPYGAISCHGALEYGTAHSMVKNSTE